MHLKTKQIKRRRKPILGYAVAALFGFAAGATVTGNASVRCPSPQDIITAHYEAVLLEIHGFGYRPDLMPPPRKPEGE